MKKNEPNCHQCCFVSRASYVTRVTCFSCLAPQPEPATCQFSVHKASTLLAKIEVITRRSSRLASQCKSLQVEHDNSKNNWPGRKANCIRHGASICPVQRATPRGSCQTRETKRKRRLMSRRSRKRRRCYKKNTNKLFCLLFFICNSLNLLSIRHCYRLYTL